MTEDAAAPPSGRALIVTVYVVSGLLTALYLFAAIPKLMGMQQAVDGFRAMGYSDGFRLVIGTAEVAGAIGLWLPRLAFWAASGLVVVMIGAVYTHLTHPETGAPTGAGIALVCLLFVAWARRRSALFLS